MAWKVGFEVVAMTFEDLSYVSQVPFVVIDLLNLSEIGVDAAEHTAWVQAGATLGHL